MPFLKKIPGYNYTVLVCMNFSMVKQKKTYDSNLRLYLFQRQSTEGKARKYWKYRRHRVMKPRVQTRRKMMEENQKRQILKRNGKVDQGLFRTFILILAGFKGA